MKGSSFLQPGPFSSLAQLRAHHEVRAPKHWFFRPVSLEIEITERCNLRCPGCAVIEEVERGEHSLAVDETLDYIRAFAETGVYGITITGGEIFLRFDDVLRVIAESPVETFKLQTNGSAFKTLSRAERHLRALDEAGFASRNQYLVPRISYSIGMQTEEGISIENLACFTFAFLKVFGTRAHFLINVTTGHSDAIPHYLRELDVAYQRIVGAPYPFESALAVQHFGYDYTLRLSDLNRISEETAPLEDRIRALPDDYVCVNFRQDQGPVPRVLIRADGTIYPCSCFGHAASPGSLRADSVRTLMERVNEDRGLELVASGGLSALLDKVRIEDPELLQLEIPKKAGICKVCKALREPHRPLYETVSTLRVLQDGHG